MRPPTINDLRSTYSMLENFVISGETTELREFYFKKFALPAMKAENPAWKPKTIEEAYQILKIYFKKEKVTAPSFIDK